MIERNNNGFVLLYAVLVASVISITGVLLSDIIFKQLVLSSIGKESQLAYYAATAGDECARYWDKKFAFGEIDGACPDCEYFPSADSSIQCNGDEINVDQINDQPLLKIFEFIVPNLQNNSCAIITVTKNLEQEKTTLFKSQGYNRGGQFCSEASPRRIEKIIYRS